MCGTGVFHWEMDRWGRDKYYGSMPDSARDMAYGVDPKRKNPKKATTSVFTYILYAFLCRNFFGISAFFRHFGLKTGIFLESKSGIMGPPNRHPLDGPIDHEDFGGTD